MTRRSQRTDSRALEGVRVLDTRPQTESGGLRARLESVGATVLELPTIAIHPVRDAVARVAPNEYDWIVFTSRNAVQAVSNLLATLAADATHHAKIAAVGKSTAAELGAHGVEVALIPDEATARALTSALVEHGVQGARILLPVGNLASGELREELERAGATVESVVVYETVPVDSLESKALIALRQGEIDVVALASPSAVRSLSDQLGRAGTEILRGTRLVCIGPTTAEAVRGIGLAPAAVARDHTVDGLVQAVIGVCDPLRSHTGER